MKVKLVVIGKTDEKFIKEGIKKYNDRIKHYLPFEYAELPDVKRSRTMAQEVQKRMEGELLLNSLQPGDYLVLLDENGKMFTSREFSGYVEKRMISGTKRIVFFIGGPYGFSGEVYNRADAKVSLSKMTFSHQIVRVIFFEQLYRAMTIIRNEPYHHD
ncbi:MAG: 23S rRNA (pseudouridine(1915)-N(3))-methyltransferase RlmH [Chlorobi bacterium]|nr:23S rRNA (pseudouridine(1915)-N(3))-methyltransferase RlmH [Chlorobiota bacterium]